MGRAERAHRVGQVVESTAALRELGAIVTHAICVVDRQAGGAALLATVGVESRSLFTKAELTGEVEVFAGESSPPPIPGELTDDELALLEHFMPLVEAELDRLGISRDDQGWIHGGTNQRPAAELFEAWLEALRALPSGMGPVAYCAYLGFDYATRKREIGY